jgi:hypothetical protein
MILWRTLSCLAISVLLSACAGMRIVDSEVRSFGSPATASTTATYQLQRLPSQQGPDFEPVAHAVATALATHGLQAVAQAPQRWLSVSWSERQLPRAPWESAPSPFFGHIWLGSAGSGGGVGMRFPTIDAPWYERGLGLILRDASSGAVVFEAQVQHDGRWSDTDAVLPAMLAAALRDYPLGHPEPQLIKIEIPR